MKYPETEQYLINADPILGQLIRDQYPLVERPLHRDYFSSLARTIVGQQISTKAAYKIFARLQAATDLKPSRVLRLSDEDIQLIGLSRQKKSYLLDLAGHFVDDPSVFNHLGELNDSDVIENLVRIKGIGEWSAQMFLIFTLARPDIFAPDDRGLQIAVEKLYELPTKPSRLELVEIANRWSPQRTRASLYLWQSLQNQNL